MFLARSRRKAKEGATGGWYAKFPIDVVHCEKLTKGNTNILEEEPFAEKREKKIDYSLIFGDPEEISLKKEELIQKSSSRKGRSGGDPEDLNGFLSTPKKITHPRFIGRSDHTVRILAQPSTPYHIDTNTKSPSQPMPPKYNCHMCDFAATRLNVIVLHNKSHSAPNRTNLGNYERPQVSNQNKGAKLSVDSKPIGFAKKRQRVSSPKSSYEINPKRPRLNKRQKEEKKEFVKEKEEKKKAIFGDWSEDENEEEEEKVKLKETIDNADSMPSSQESDSDNRMSDDDFFSNTDDHHSVDSDDDFIISKPTKNNTLPLSIACTKPLRKRKVNLELFTKKQDVAKPKVKIGEKAKTKTTGNKKTESVVDAVNSLIKSKLQPNKTYVSSERSKLNSRAEIVDVLRKTPLKQTKVHQVESQSSKKKKTTNNLNVSQLLSETKLPEIPSLPERKTENKTKTSSQKSMDVFESNFSSSDSGAQGASSAEEQSSPPASPPPNTPSKKPGILKKSSTRSIQLPTRPNGNSQLIKHEESGTKYAVISAKAKAKQLARTQMAKDELLAKNEESASKDLSTKEENHAALTLRIEGKIEPPSNIITKELDTKKLKDTQGSKQKNDPLCNGDRLLKEELGENDKANYVDVKKDKTPEKMVETGEKDEPQVKLVMMETSDIDAKENIDKKGTKEDNMLKEQKMKKQSDAKMLIPEKHDAITEKLQIIEKSHKSKKDLASEFDFIDDLSKQSITNLSDSRKSGKFNQEKSDISNISNNQAKSLENKIAEKDLKVSPNKQLSKTVPIVTSLKKTEVSPAKPMSKPPPIANIAGINSEKYSAFVKQKFSPSKIVQGVPKTTEADSPSMVVIKANAKPNINNTIMKISPKEPLIKIIGSSTQAVTLPFPTSSSLQTTKIISKPASNPVNPTTLKVSKPLLTVFNPNSVSLSNAALSSSKPTVNLICKPSPSLVSKPVVIQEKKPTVTIISKPNLISIEKSAQIELKALKPKVSSPGLTIIKSQVEPAKKPVMATVSKLIIEPVVKPSTTVQNKTVVSVMNKPVLAGFTKVSESISTKPFVPMGSKHLLTQQPLSLPNKPILLQNNKPSISSISKPALSPLKMGNKVVTLSHKKESIVHKSPEVMSDTKPTQLLLSPTKGSEKPLTVSLEPKKIVIPAMERSKPIVKTVELPKRAVEVAAALKPLASPTKPIVFMENNEKKGTSSTLEIELENSPVSEFIVAVNEPVSDKSATQSSTNVLSINDLATTEAKISGASSIVLPAEVGQEGLTAFNLSSGGLQFIGDQELAGMDADGEMPIYLLVDDGTDPNLENQTLYIDSSQLTAATGGMILQNASGSGIFSVQTTGAGGNGSVLMSAGNMLQGNEGPVIIQASSDSGQMFIQNADGQLVLQDNGALSNVVMVEDKDASAMLHGLVTSADTTGGVATLPAHPSSSLLAQVPLISTPSQQGPIMVSSTRKDEKK